MEEAFKRIEKKYVLSEEQYNKLIRAIQDRIEKDKYFESSIINIYFDTDEFDLIVESLEKPIYKEKIRLRAYKQKGENNIYNKFLEIKKKYKDIVYKKRIKIKDEKLQLDEVCKTNDDNIVAKEIEFAFNRYNLKPKIYIAYDRNSYYLKEDNRFRITFDFNLRYRTENLDLKDTNNYKYFNKNECIMEIKILNAYPLWLVKILEELSIFPSSFSKYGKIYTKIRKEEKKC